MDKQKKEGNKKKSNLYLPTARRTARTVGARGGGLRERLRERDSGGQWGTVGDGGRQWGRRVGARESEKRERSKCGGNWNLGLEGKQINPPDFPRPHLRDCGRGKYLIHDPHMQMWVVNNPRPQFHKVWS